MPDKNDTMIALLDYLKRRDEVDSRERRELYGRIQNYLIPDGYIGPKSTEGKHLSDNSVVQKSELTDHQIASKWGLIENPGGGWYDNESGKIFDKVATAVACKELRNSKGIPLEDAIDLLTGGNYAG